MTWYILDVGSYFALIYFYPNSQAYENYSFEELRFTSPAIKRSSENMLVRPNSDGTYSATWTPGSVGWYSVLVTIDGYDMEEVSIDKLLVVVAWKPDIVMNTYMHENFGGCK